MKRILLPLIIGLGVVTACKKDKSKPDPVIDSRPPQEVVESLTTQLADADSISSFTTALKEISLTKEETAQGLTVFAPLDEGATSVSSISSAKTSADSTQLTEKVLKDHLVKGVLKTSDLVNGKNITSLSGKTLRITRDGDKIWINGVLISGTDITSGSKEAIYVVQKRLSNTTVADTPSVARSLEITVWNALMWSPAQPKGEIASDADVVVYRSQQDYANNLPAYQGKTNADGRVKFQNIPSGRYYIKVSKGDISNIFYQKPTQENGVYKGLAAIGIIQSMADLDTIARQGTDAQPGNFRWMDTDADGVISTNDFTALPYESAEAKDGLNVQASVWIGYEDNLTMGPVRTEARALNLLQDAEDGIGMWHKEMVMLDGVLSDDADAHQSVYQPIDNFTFATTHSLFYQNWNAAYQIVSSLNKLIRDVPSINMGNKNQVLAQAKALRAYVYLQLATYFGNVPLQKEPEMSQTITNSTRQQVIDFVISELDNAASALPQTGGPLNAVSIKALQAKAALLNKDNAKAKDYAAAVIASAKYQLVATPSIFNSGSTEAIWDNSKVISGVFRAFFGSNRTICPFVRITEIYLINAEAALATNNASEALDRLNPVLQRSGIPTISQGASNDSIRNVIRITWKSEMQKEGNRFANLVRWGIAGETLAIKGFQEPKHQLLPIPEGILNQYPNIVQNPGY